MKTLTKHLEDKTGNLGERETDGFGKEKRKPKKSKRKGEGSVMRRRV